MIQTITTQAVVHELKTIFARFGVPETLVTDNGSQFASREFKAFMESWSFIHITTSTRYPQLNGKAENAVKTVKGLLRNAKNRVSPNFKPCWIGVIPQQRLLALRNS